MDLAQLIAAAGLAASVGIGFIALVRRLKLPAVVRRLVDGYIAIRREIEEARKEQVSVLRDQVADLRLEINDQDRRIERLERDNAALRDANTSLGADNESLRKRVDELEKFIADAFKRNGMTPPPLMRRARRPRATHG